MLTLGIARDIHWRAGEAFALLVTGMCLGYRGNYTRALALLGDSLAITEEIAHHQWQIVTRLGLGGIALDLLHRGEARTHFERALALARENNSPQWIRVATGLLARAHIAQGDLAGAASLLDGVLLDAPPAQTVAQRHIWYARARHALARGEAEIALDIADELLRCAPNIPATPHDARRAIPSLALLCGEALIALGREDEAEAALRATQEGARAYGMQPILWRACRARRALPHGASRG